MILPAIEKLWVIFPLLTTLKITVVPTGTLRLDNVKENSLAETTIVTGAWFAEPSHCSQAETPRRETRFPPERRAAEAS